MLAGLGAGVYRDVAEAIVRCVRPNPAIDPNPAAQAAYDERFAAWRRLFAAAVTRRRGR
jgi:xylulokinase